MSNIIEITKVLIKNNIFGFASSKKKGKKTTSKGNAIGFFMVMIISSLFLGIPIVFALDSLLASYDLSELILSFALPIGGITSIIFGVFSIVSVFYLNKDSEHFLHFPIKSSELLMAKFFASLISEYLMLIMFIFPIIFGVGIGSEASAIFYLYAIAICLLMPIIPTVIMAIIIMLANKVFNFGKRKDLFMYVMTAFILLFSFAYSFSMTYLIDENSSANLIAVLGGDISGFIKIARLLFPPFNSAVYSLCHYNEFIGFASIMTFIGFNILSLVVLYFVGDKLYIKGITKTSGDKKQTSKEKYKESNHGIMWELINKEWIGIKRSPVFMLNIVVANLIFPFILLMSFLISGDTASFNGYIDFSNGGILFIAIGILLVLSSMSTATSSAISREGNGAWMMKVVPVSLKKQMDAKVYFSMILDLIVCFVIEFVLFIMFNVPLSYVVLVNIPLIIVLLILNYLSLIIDLKNPKLTWKEENEAVKQNFNVILSMIVNLIASAVFVVGGILLLKYNINIYLLFGSISVVLFVVYLGLVNLIKKNQIKLFSKVG